MSIPIWVQKTQDNFSVAIDLPVLLVRIKAIHGTSAPHWCDPPLLPRIDFPMLSKYSSWNDWLVPVSSLGKIRPFSIWHANRFFSRIDFPLLSKYGLWNDWLILSHTRLERLAPFPSEIRLERQLPHKRSIDWLMVQNESRTRSLTLEEISGTVAKNLDNLLRPST